mgnify:CR=1 FL=1|jgi:hypothetical protein
MRKIVGLALIGLLAASTLIILKPAWGATKPSIPQFTLKPVDQSYDVPITYSIDPLTGENITHEGYHVKKQAIDITIKNQHYFNTQYKLLYNVRVKNHFGSDWVELYSPFGDCGPKYPSPSSSDYTVLQYHWDYGSDVQLDFQVRALVGHYYEKSIPDHPLAGVFPAYDTVESSGWSGTQTFSFNDTSLPTPTTAPSATPNDATTPQDITGSETATVPSLDWVQLTILALLAVIAATLLVIAVTYLRRKG